MGTDVAPEFEFEDFEMLFEEAPVLTHIVLLDAALAELALV